jgi:hypothetical protein
VFFFPLFIRQLRGSEQKVYLEREREEKRREEKASAK